MNKKGFTLVELLATIVILGLIMTIVATKGFGAFDNSKTAINDLNEKAIKEGINLLSVEIEQCDDETDDSENLKEVLGIESENCSATSISNGCECLKKNLEDNSIFSISLEKLKENEYINGSDIDSKDFENSIVYVQYSHDNLGIIKSGDVNIDGQVTDADSELISNYIVGNISLTNQQKKIADLDCNGKINVADSTRISKLIDDPTIIFPCQK